MKKCGLEGCNDKYYSKDYCARHYSQSYRGNKPTLRTGNTHRPAIIKNDIALLEIGLSGEYTLVDKEFAYLDQYKWNLSDTGYPKAFIDGKTVTLHKIVMGYPDKTVDHINRNKLDNRTQNLRLCDFRQNGGNRGLSSRNRTGYKGVIKTPAGKWLVSFDSKYRGTFSDIQEAAQKYNELAIERWGEFSNLNKITIKEQ